MVINLFTQFVTKLILNAREAILRSEVYSTGEDMNKLLNLSRNNSIQKPHKKRQNTNVYFKTNQKKSAFQPDA